MSRLLGGTVGTALIGTFFAKQPINETRMAAEGIARELIARMSVVEAYRYILLIVAGISAIAIFVSIGAVDQPAKEDLIMEPVQIHFLLSHPIASGRNSAEIQPNSLKKRV